MFQPFDLFVKKLGLALIVRCFELTPEIVKLLMGYTPSEKGHLIPFKDWTNTYDAGIKNGLFNRNRLGQISRLIHI